MSSAEQTEGQGAGGERHRAGALDIRSIIGALIGVYGIVLIVMGLVHDTHEARVKAGGVNANLWAGIVMLVVALGFLLWARLRPIVVKPGAGHAEDAEDARPHH